MNLKNELKTVFPIEKIELNLNNIHLNSSVLGTVRVCLELTQFHNHPLHINDLGVLSDEEDRVNYSSTVPNANSSITDINAIIDF